MKKLYTSLLVFTLAACEIPESGVPTPILEPIKSFSVSEIPACRTGYTKGSPKKSPTPDAFLVTLFEFVKSTCANDILYGVNAETRDAFSYLSKELGVSKDSQRDYRCAAMFELVRASGAFESDYRWQQGRDKSASNFDFYTMESAFLVTLFEFVKSTCTNDTLYGVNSEARDAFTYLSGELDVSKESSRPYRCAAMFELVRASGAFESDYRWQQGRDKSASNYDFYTMESGLFQTSPNSHYYAHKGYGRWAYLDALVAKHGVGIVRQGSPENEKWNKLMKDETKKHVIIEHHVFMLRHNYKHYGPIIDKANRVGVNLNKQCIAEVLKLL